MHLSEAHIIESLYSHGETIDSEANEPDYVFLIDIFWIRFEGDLGFSIFIKRETFEDRSDFIMREDGGGSTSEVDGVYLSF